MVLAAVGDRCYSAGAFGGVRAAMQLRATLAELGMPSIPSIQRGGVPFEFVEEAANPTHVRRIARRSVRFELVLHLRHLKRARAEGVPY